MPLRIKPNEIRVLPSLVPLGGGKERPPVVLADPAVVLGSGTSAQVRMKSQEVSKAHALILIEDGKAYIRDLASRTQLFINDEVVKEAILKQGDLIRVGAYRFAFREDAGVGLHPHPMPPTSIIFRIESSGELRQISGRAVLMGRRAGCDLIIEDDSASGAHAVVFSLGSKWYLRDLGSRTGTFINGIQGKTRGQVELRPQDVIRVGPAEVRFLGTVTPPTANLTSPTAASVGEAPNDNRKVDTLILHSNDSFRASESSTATHSASAEFSNDSVGVEDGDSSRTEDSLAQQRIAPPISEVLENLSANSISPKHESSQPELQTNETTRDGGNLTDSPPIEPQMSTIGDDEMPAASEDLIDHADASARSGSPLNEPRTQSATVEKKRHDPVMIWSFDELTSRMRDQHSTSEPQSPAKEPDSRRGRVFLILTILILLLAGATVAGVVTYKMLYAH